MVTASMNVQSSTSAGSVTQRKSRATGAWISSRRPGGRSSGTAPTASTLNHVAEEAGLTSGAVLYHYPDLSELLVEAHHAGMERFYEQRLQRIAGTAPTPRRSWS